MQERSTGGMLLPQRTTPTMWHPRFSQPIWMEIEKPFLLDQFPSLVPTFLNTMKSDHFGPSSDKKMTRAISRKRHWAVTVLFLSGTYVIGIIVSASRAPHIGLGSAEIFLRPIFSFAWLPIFPLAMVWFVLLGLLTLIFLGNRRFVFTPIITLFIFCLSWIGLVYITVSFP